MHIIALKGYNMHYKNQPHLAVERFHAEFLRVLAMVLAPGLYAVKGGVNLRLCLGSVRCSEDLDLDVHKVSAGTLGKNVDKILGDRLPKVLMPLGFSLRQFSSPKQTGTVQRWKIALDIQGSPVPTKVEFSRRGMGSGIRNGLVHAQVVMTHHMPPFALPHYDEVAATQQKVAALAGRPLTQARDIFDLHYLLSFTGGRVPAGLNGVTLKKAAENCLSISYGDYRGQVVAYLPVEHRPGYEGEAVWKSMQDTVFQALDAASGEGL